MEEVEDDEVVSIPSDSSDSSDDYTVDVEEADDDEEQSPADSPPSDETRKSQNVDALISGNLVVKRQPLIPRVLSVSDGAAIARKPFKPPCSSGYSDQKEQLVRRLWARKRFVPWGSSRPVVIGINNRTDIPSAEKDTPDESVALPEGIEPLVLWQSEESGEECVNSISIMVDPVLVRFLRPHQREGVQFMFDCVSGLCAPGVFGCILADDMGLGKTLQSIALLYTLLRQGFDGEPMAKKTIIESEIKKWVGDRLQLIALCESTRDDVVSGIDSFIRLRSPYQVLIVSYETFRLHSSKFDKSGSCDLLICDEAHRLKNDQTLTNRALAGLSCNRRILLSGTPMQNDLEEFFAMVNFTNPGILGDAAYFRRYYESPIISGREPTATEEERNRSVERSAELSTKVNQFILRRTNALLSNHLPPKIVEVVCCKLSPLQTELYNHFIHSKNVKRAISEEAKQSKILAYITALKKLCNHPKLIYDTIKSGSGKSGFEDCIRFFPPEMFSGRSGSWTGGDGVWVELSGKMHVLARLLAQLRRKTDDRIVLVSNYTQTLDLFAQLCRERRYPYLRLDGTTSISKRQKLVNSFNDPSRDEFVFLLSSKAGGCGLNLIGGNRLVLFDPDWNPANDKQAAARVWRDGQKKRVYIYRFLSTGTIEEKVYQRQMSKEGLQKVIQKEKGDNLKSQGNALSTEDLRDLFTFYEKSRSEIHENMKCCRCKTCESEDNAPEVAGEVEEGATSQDDQGDIGGFQEISGCLDKLKSSEKQLGTPLEEDLGSWGHHFLSATVPDSILQASAGDEVTFVFTNQVDGKLVPIESMRSTPRGAEGNKLHAVTRVIQNQKSTSLLQQHAQRSPVISSNVDSNSSCKTAPGLSRPSLTGPMKFTKMSTQSRTAIPTKPRTSFGKQLPLKRLSSDSNDHDDDFM
ncbi:hypothetical protein MKW94_008298 [Papaver nudicaule]|uniref:DNA repair and recombination protein RAD54 n=1 Tax=Papaver nudicaule TaxID=74823 RepID=A0AA41VE80_PAPNU|nr:hypothetical protein [Papaver nudicaule]